VNTEATTAAGTHAAETATIRRQAVLWYWQRISAMVLAVCVVVHLAGIVYAVRGGLSAAEILGRTRGSWGFAAFYAVFVVACAVHAPIGIANVVAEVTGARGRVAGVVAQVFCALILVLGLRAIYAVVA
jgi:fumarate reductase subunit C